MTQHYGPIYCETGHPFALMAEPVNTISNAVIIVMGLLALRFVLKQKERSRSDLMILVVLLLATGVGSTFWHALRTPLWLVLDWLPGVLFLLTFIFLWLRALYGSLAAALGLGAMFALFRGGALLMRQHWHGPMPAGAGSPLVFAPFFAALFGIGFLFVLATWRKFGQEQAGASFLLLALAAAGAFFRSVDLLACTYVPAGTHFLWHVFLSAAAYHCIVFLSDLKVVKPAAQ